MIDLFLTEMVIHLPRPIPKLLVPRTINEAPELLWRSGGQALHADGVNFTAISAPPISVRPETGGLYESS
jgi:hypothetical protein